MSYWQGKRAVITGGSAGLGHALAARCVMRTRASAIIGRRAETLEQTAEELRFSGGNVLAVGADVTNQQAVERLVGTVHSAWGGLDLLCNCAGRSMRGTVLATSIDEFRDLLEVNFLSAVRCTQAFAPALAEGHGHAVLVGSLASKVAAGYLGAYPASKFPLAALAQQLRMDLSPSGLHTLLVCPGPLAREDQRQPNLEALRATTPDVPAAAHNRAAARRWE